MKRTATALLVGAAGVYAAATAWGGPHPVWGYVTAFSEAAMVGAIADWFAVSALFRHPLGLPIPHTAIIPRNKERIGRNLADFICNNFLSTPQLLAKIRAFDPGRRLADWLAEPAHAEQVGTHLVAAAQYGLRALDDQRLHAFLHDTLSAGLRQLDLSHAVGQLLDAATSERRHQKVLDELLLQLAELLQKEGLQETLADAIAKEVKGLRYVGLDRSPPDWQPARSWQPPPARSWTWLKTQTMCCATALTKWCMDSPNGSSMTRASSDGGRPSAMNC